MTNEVLLEGKDRWQGVSGQFQVTQCPTCEAGITLPRTPNAELVGFYPTAYAPYVPVERGPAAMIWRFLQRRALAGRPLNALTDRAPGRIVDVGCGRGDLAASLIKLGWVATGVEPSAGACEVARARGIEALQGTLDTVELEQESYDAAVMQHALEHLADPASDLRQIHDALRVGGELVVIIPNFGCWQRKRFKSHWFHLDLPRHRTHFTPASLRTAIERSGLSVVEIGTNTSAVGLPGSIQYRIAGRCLFPSGLPLRLATGLAYLLLPISLVLNKLGGGGDFLWAVARRER